MPNRMSSFIRWKSVVKKVKMGKKEKGAKEKGTASSEEEQKSSEEYQCTGNLEQDFTELCVRLGLIEIPRVVPRLRPPSTPSLDKTIHDSEWSFHSDKDSLSPFPTKDRFSYFKPCIHIETDSEDSKAVREVFIRGWKIDEKMMGVFSKCLPAVTSLHGVHLWNVGLTDDTLTSFVTFLPRCTALKMIVLDGNPLPRQSYYKLLSEESLLSHVSLRNNNIDDEGAKLIGRALSTLKTGNRNLVSLNLSYNHISDQGATYISEGLRLNRSLLSLSLAHNRIGDQGAIKLAEVLGPFALTHEEIVERRRLLLEKEPIERQRSPSTSRKSESKGDRPVSHPSSTAIDKVDKTAKPSKSASKKKEKSQESAKKDEKAGTGGGGSQAASASAPGGQGATAAKKEDSKAAKKPSSITEPKTSRSKTVKSANKDKRPPAQEPEQSAEQTETVHPLLEQADHHDGKVFLPGNRTLINLNLMRNFMTEVGLQAFLAAVHLQTQLGKPASSGTNQLGLLRLSLAKNSFPASSKAFLMLQDLMLNRDPLRKNVKPPEEEQTASG
ncbi:leucine-rich repeat-containing protein 71 isoform X2 [Protopterus annectens]|uniref:leucine-rich repeat-containing protein 71 isoform X2 n=1 Tax=Protopterus annectens TaxID=7888 RepID=UPI001CFB0063|nr:leucine-rich repeat-containing protein 71 isoform X2 [Protopterus annectens]